MDLSPTDSRAIATKIGATRDRSVYALTSKLHEYCPPNRIASEALSEGIRCRRRFGCFGVGGRPLEAQGYDVRCFASPKNSLHNIIRPRLGAFGSSMDSRHGRQRIAAAPSGIRQSIVGCHHLGIDRRDGIRQARKLAGEIPCPAVQGADFLDDGRGCRRRQHSPASRTKIRQLDRSSF